MTIRTKIVALLSSVLVFGVAAAGFAVFNLVRAGDELRLVAEDHVPLMTVLSQVTAQHLEQSVRFERSLRFGSGPTSPEYESAKSDFEELAAAIWTDLQRGRAIADRTMSRPNGDQPREGAEPILTLLKRLDRAHNDYAQSVRAVFSKFDGGRRSEALRLAKQIEQQEDGFDQALGSVLVEVSTVTERASVRAKGNENEAVLVTSVLSGLAILVAGVVVVFCVRLVSHVKFLTGLLPICAGCKRIRDDCGYWNQLESYIERYSGAEFTHGICAECQDKLYEKISRSRSEIPLVTGGGVADPDDCQS